MTDSGLCDRVILVVEDEFLLADELVASLKAAGAIVLGPARTLGEGFLLSQETTCLDGAILDVNLHGVMSFPLAQNLSARGVPFLFTTGYDPAIIPAQYERIALCEKPTDAHQVLQALQQVLHA